MAGAEWAFTPDRLELVGMAGEGHGEIADSLAHRAPGRLHRAFSLFLVDTERRLLIQRRSIFGRHSQGLWSHTCGGHPAVGEPPGRAAERALARDFGVTSFGLTEAGTVRYRLSISDAAGSPLVEHEWNHVFVGLIRGVPRPNVREVADYDLVPLDEVAAVMSVWRFTAWFRIVWRVAHPALAAPMGRIGVEGGFR